MRTALATLFAMTLATAAFADESGVQSDPVERYQSIFTQLDTDSSQTLDTDEAAAAGLAGDSFTRLDSNGDGVLSLEEFLVLATETEDSGVQPQ